LAPASRTRPPRPPRLLAVADPATGAADSGPGFVAWCSGLAGSGVDGLLLRDRELSDRLRLARATVARAEFAPPAIVLAHGRLDLALLAGADGVHLPAEGVPLAPLRAAAPYALLCGRATHSLEEVVRARDEGCDYALFGPVFSTPSKVGRIAPRGISSLAEAAAHGLPVIAIGGIDESNAEAVAAAGAWGIAAIRLFAGCDAGTIRRLRTFWSDETAT